METLALGMWAMLYPEKKIIFVSFEFKCFYSSDTGKNIFKKSISTFNNIKHIIKIKKNIIIKILSWYIFSIFIIIEFFFLDILKMCT